MAAADVCAPETMCLQVLSVHKCACEWMYADALCMYEFISRCVHVANFQQGATSLPSCMCVYYIRASMWIDVRVYTYGVGARADMHACAAEGMCVHKTEINKKKKVGVFGGLFRKKGEHDDVPDMPECKGKEDCEAKLHEHHQSLAAVLFTRTHVHARTYTHPTHTRTHASYTRTLARTRTHGICAWIDRHTATAIHTCVHTHLLYVYVLRRERAAPSTPEREREYPLARERVKTPGWYTSVP